MQRKQKRFFYVLIGAILFFSFFVFGEVKAVANCGCTLKLKYTGDQAKLPCYDDKGAFKEGNNCDCDYTDLIKPPFPSDTTFIFEDVWKKFEEIPHPVIPGSTNKCALFKFLQDLNDNLLSAKINPTGDDCTYDSGSLNKSFSLNSSNYDFNYSMSCVSSPIEPVPPPVPPVVVNTQCDCYENQTSIDAKTPEGSVQNDPEIESGCTKMSTQKSGENYTYLMCNYFINGVFKSSWSKGESVDPNKITATVSTNPNPGPAVSSNQATKNWIKTYYKMPLGYTGVIPECAFSGTCENVNDLLQLGINVGKYVFSIIGSVAFLAFVYGGFTIVFSFGSAEKVKKGTEILVAAVTGMVIAFGAYLLINFILDALTVTQDFRGIK